MGPEIIVFDLNGTLLDLAVLDGHFERIFGAASYREKWFAQLQILWMSTVATGTYQPFAKLAQAALEMLAAKESVDLFSADEKAVASQLTELPAFAEVPAALGQLRAGGFRLVALTNGARPSAQAQLGYAGIADAFEAIFSTDDVERFKPAPEPYLYVAKQLDVKPEKLLMVAAHAWDVAGAHQVGLSSAFVARPRQVLNPLATKPDHTVNDLAELVHKLC